MTGRRLISISGAILGMVGYVGATPFTLPTPNEAIDRPDGGGADYYVGTVGRPWPSGTFGCVRSEGHRIHEGIDIRCVNRDERGEPIDPIFATAKGEVVYINRKAGLSNYGKYLVIRHQIDRIDLFSLYAHLSKAREDLEVGDPVDAGQVIGVMGRTTNTRQGISRERAHLHFELNLLLNDAFESWFENRYPTEENDHGKYHGWNLVGIDPTDLLRARHDDNEGFSLRRHLRSQEELCRVLIPAAPFSWLYRYPHLIERNPTAEKEGFAAYEVALDFNGVPFRLIPRGRSELEGRPERRLLSVNEELRRTHPCRDLVKRSHGEWAFSRSGRRRIELLTHP